jgi:hypothetical protein
VFGLGADSHGESDGVTALGLPEAGQDFVLFHCIFGLGWGLQKQWLKLYHCGMHPYCELHYCLIHLMVASPCGFLCVLKLVIMRGSFESGN